MKIMGNNGEAYDKKRYFLSASERELANLMGYSYAERELKEKMERAGAEIPISAMYDRLYRMASMGKELTEIGAKLKAAGDFVDTALPTIKKVNAKGEEDKSE